MIEILRREAVYLWYYASVQFLQIGKYWVLGMAIGSFVSVFAKKTIRRLLSGLRNSRMGLAGIIPACLLGIASPLCMYGTIPIAASLSEEGMRDDWLASFMMASILLNPQLIVYSAALGTTVLVVRIVSCFFCGIAAGLSLHFFAPTRFFDFHGFPQTGNHDTDTNLCFRYVKNFGRNIKATGPYFLFGILLSALFARYVPSDKFARLFGRNEGFGVLMAATIGVPLYACGGGTIPLIAQWLSEGMSMGSATAFMITGPATKITNLGALKIVLGIRHFLWYLAFVMLFSFLCGWLVNLLA